MRISDWSSDVCSSDLVGRLAAIRHPDMEELMNRNNSSEYRYDIDGLRAIAVTSVVIFHLFHNALSRGFLGVDIFFVISRSEERSVGKEWVRTCRSRWSPDH